MKVVAEYVPEYRRCRNTKPHDGHAWEIVNTILGPIPAYWCAGWIKLNVTVVTDADRAAEMYER